MVACHALVLMLELMYILVVPCSVCHLNSSKCTLRGVYVGAPSKVEAILRSVVPGVNAVVIDVKDDSGNITYNLGDDGFKPYYKSAPMARDIVLKLKSMGFYTIARIVAFKDKKKALSDSKLAVTNLNGTVYVDKEKMVWLNPYKKATHDYLISIAKLAADAGFDEVQFDYIRFSHYSSMLKNTNVWRHIEKKSRINIVNEFLSKVVNELHKKHVKMSVDVFGCIIPEAMSTYKSDSENLGQDYVKISQIVDYICPMIYPSHWPANSCGVQKPDINPYKIVDIVMQLSKKALGREQVKVRPWLQAFTASWLKRGMWKKYGNKEVKQQIDASVKHGVKEICLWNPSGNYKQVLAQ